MAERLRRVSTRASSTSVFNRYRALVQIHRSLEEKLDAETGRPAPDDQLIRRIKKRKLLIKDEMAGIERLLEAIGAESEIEADLTDVVPLPISSPGSGGLQATRDRAPAA